MTEYFSVVQDFKIKKMTGNDSHSFSLRFRILFREHICKVSAILIYRYHIQKARVNNYFCISCEVAEIFCQKFNNILVKRVLRQGRTETTLLLSYRIHSKLSYLATSRKTW